MFLIVQGCDCYVRWEEGEGVGNGWRAVKLFIAVKIFTKNRLFTLVLNYFHIFYSCGRSGAIAHILINSAFFSAKG